MKFVSCLLLFLITVGFTCFGQLNKGTILLGGSMGYSQDAVSDEDLKSSFGNPEDKKELSINPRMAIFLKNNLAAGLAFNYEHSKLRWWDNTNLSFQKSQNQTISLGPFVRYYHFIRPELAIFGQASITYHYNYYQDDTYKLAANLKPGLAYFISPKIALELNLGGFSYSRTVYKPDEDYRAILNEIDLQLINGIQVGASFYLRR